MREAIVSPQQYFKFLRGDKEHVQSLRKQRDLFEQLVKVEKSTRQEVAEVPVVGISFRFLENLHRLVRDTDNRALTSITTGDIWRDYVVPLTHNGCNSVVEMLSKGEQPHEIFNGGATEVGHANIFVTHTWGGTFDELYLTLRRVESHPDFADVKNKRYWIDIFTVNQYHEHNFYGTLQTAIGAIRRTVCVLWPWKDPRVLKRSWCLWELFCSMEAEPPFDVDFFMSQKQERALQKDLFDDLNDSFSNRVWRQISNIDSEKAIATYDKDRDYIKQRIEAGPGFDAINEQVRSCLKNLVSQLVYDLVPMLKGKNKAQINAVRLLKDIGRLEKDPFQSSNEPKTSDKGLELEELGQACENLLAAIKKVKRREFIRKQKQASIARYRTKKQERRRFKPK
eukprot:CAMPEP_0204861092 /NCGR_PEP_ID=MMETSP1348-20121228/1210_1 /ASSEMBLY_ACC=CAM_ASM_000700 /TAXON_ID=215587 /ORGANISM="Aplanochytrium stocchinoi, Strain GSBS06" /LENGTH=395 /DNA_ID=CAMNT_0052010261 /DNA_START=168 /DNA_END=1355 /DNA_ORIENTATION=+